ncbi:MAG TPA: HD domain-containing protein [Chroococcales cyanobacterium]
MPEYLSLDALGIPALSRLASLTKQEIYLVGGFLRDRLLGKKRAVDVDLVIDGDPLPLLREFGGNFIPLDPDFGIYRIFVGSLYFDVARMQGENIFEDLLRRDFSINAMGAGPLSEQSFPILDPAGGREDLEKKVIRAISRKNFRDDPLRLLRAFRFSANFGFEIEKNTLAWISALASRIGEVSFERISAETFKLLASPSADVLEEMGECGLLSALFPELSLLSELAPNEHHHLGALAHSIEAVRQLEGLLEHSDWLGPLKKDLFDYLDSSLAHERKVLPGLKFATLLHDVGKPSTFAFREGRPRFIGHDKEGANIAKKIALRLKLSVREVSFIETLVRHHMRPGLLATQGEASPKAIYRFFRDTKADGVAVLLLSLADRLSAQGPAVTPLDNEKNFSLVLRMLEDFFRAPEKVCPAPLLNGKEVMEILGITSGPLVGKTLQELVEAQVQGLLKEKGEAIAWLQSK